MIWIILAGSADLIDSDILPKIILRKKRVMLNIHRNRQITKEILSNVDSVPVKIKVRLNSADIELSR